MKRFEMRIFFVAVISLLLNAIWHGPAVAAMPVIESLGRISAGLLAPSRLDVDASGNLYVADSRTNKVFKYDKFGELVRSYSGVKVAGTGIAVTPDGGLIYVAGRDIVEVLDAVTGKVKGHLGAGAGEFSYAGEIDLDAAGYVFAADSGTKYVHVYNPAGEFQYKFGGLGTSAGKFRTIWAMSVNEQAGEVYVADIQTTDTSYPKIQVFDLAGNLLRTLLASNGFGATPIGYFGGITFDQSGRGYFLDSLRSNLRVLGLPATYLGGYVTTGYGMGQLAGPTDVVFDPTTGRLFVACDGARVEIFGVDGAGNPDAANQKPSSPVPLNPISDSEVASVNPQLNYQNALDPDGDALTYDVRVFAGETLVAEYLGLPEGEAVSYAQVDIALEENGLYGWTAQAFDGRDTSDWAPLQSFYVNTLEEPPSVPVLLAPLDGETLDGGGLLSWQSAADPDPLDEVGYVVEISADAAFGNILLEEAVAGTSVPLTDLTGYKELKDGAIYFWRVKSVDNHGLVSEGSGPGSFLYDVTLLQVTSNMPGARVHLGGNHGYAGRFLGVAPLEVRDFPAGAASVVVEREGFEPYVVQVNPLEGDNVVVYAELVPAIAPADLKARPLQAADVDILLGGDAAPFAIDYDNDGLTDLLIAEASGALNFYKGSVTSEGEKYYSQGQPIAVPLIPGAAPCVVDWDNDGRKDLLVGAADGTVTLLLNAGSESAPSFDGGSLLQVSGVPISIGAAAVPAVVDIEGDGDKDLAVGSALGSVVLYRNDGSDEAPQLVAAGKLISLSSPVAPFFVDWDGDGVRDLLVAASEHLYQYVRINGVFTPVGVLAVGSSLVNPSGGSAGSGAFSLGDRLRLFAFDEDGQKGKDLIVGNAAGEVRVVSSHGMSPVAAFSKALLDKVAQIDEICRESAPEFLAQVAEIASAIESGDLKTAERLVKGLGGSVPAGTDLAKAVDELGLLLR